MILWRFSRCGEFFYRVNVSYYKWKLYTSRNSNREQFRKIHQLKGPPARRNRTFACAMPVHCSDHKATEIADRSKRD